MRDAATGEVLFGAYSGRDTGNGLVGDVRPDVRGIEVWASIQAGTTASGLLSAKGTILSATKPDLVDATIHFAAEPTTQTISGNRDGAKRIVDWHRGTLLTETDTSGNPPLVADILGDWREELLIHTADSTALRIYTTTEVTTHKLTTLMHDKQYRAEIARQNTVYNYPTQPGFYRATDTDWSTVPILTTPVTPKAPQFIDPRGHVLDLIVVPWSANVDYYIDGKKVRAGLHKGAPHDGDSGRGPEAVLCGGQRRTRYLVPQLRQTLRSGDGPFQTDRPERREFPSRRSGPVPVA